jgi:GntR family transcriptional regulator/MocR family aminotransferase
MRTSSALELLVSLDRERPEALHRQLEQALRDSIRSGRLVGGAALPSTRALAAQLGVSRGIVVEAYEQLGAEGYLASRPGGATHVATGARPTPTRAYHAAEDRFEFDFRSGRADLDLFPREAWLRSVRRALGDAPSERLGYLGGRGVPELRQALAEYLDRVRGTAVDPECIVVCSGFTQGLKLLAAVLRDSGARRIAIEDPTQQGTGDDLRALGLDVADVDAVVVTAAHQFPTGAVLTPDRRAALMAWAERRGGLIVEDDYDAEFRYDREPIGAIQGLSPERVVYAGSASKILAPGLRLGWFVVPAAYVDAMTRAKRTADSGSPALDQLAFADFLARGELDRHLRRLRPIYRARRDALLDALARHLPELRPVGASAGLHVLAWLPPDLDEATVVEAAAVRGVRIQGVGPRPGGAAVPGGIIFGYGALGETAIERAIDRLASALGTARRGTTSRP